MSDANLVTQAQMGISRLWRNSGWTGRVRIPLLLRSNTRASFRSVTRNAYRSELRRVELALSGRVTRSSCTIDDSCIAVRIGHFQ
jgi:hypothetical protein